MPIEVTCECGKRFRAKDEYAGKRGICPACKQAFVVPVSVDLEPLEPQIASMRDAATTPGRDIKSDLAGQGKPAPEQTESKSRKRFWHDPVVIIGATVPIVSLIAFIAYLVGVNVGSKRGPTDRIDINSTSPELSLPHEPKAQVKHPYQVIDEIHKPPHPRLSSDGHRMIYVRLNGKVSEDVLREISMELKAKNTEPFVYTTIWFWLPGKGEGMGPGNTSAWAMTRFNGNDPSVQIVGLSLEDEHRYRTDPVILPVDASDVGIWLIDNGVGSQQLVFYRINDEWRWHFHERDEKKQRHILLKELPDDDGRCLQPTGSIDRYIVLPNGDLKIYGGSRRLLAYVCQQSPPPPIRRTTHPSTKIR
jgi:hypothetical protein